MPELPEVEILRRDLAKVIKGQVVQSAENDWPKMLSPLTLKKFQQQIKNQKITGVARRAKILVLTLSGGKFLLFHLKLTGQLIFRPQHGHLVVGGHPMAPQLRSLAVGGAWPEKGYMDHLPNKFTHLTLTFKSGAKLFFNDMRKFGWARLTGKEGLTELTQGLGVEPLSRGFTLEKFKEILKKYPNRKIKQLLFDQTLISGLGNIYVDESCFYAKIKPIRTAGSLKPKEIKGLYEGIKKVLRLSIAKKGTSFNTYVHVNGGRGGFVPYLKVYGRAGEKCRRCGNIVKKIKLNGRGTQFCAVCQK